MNQEQILDALEFIDDDMIESVNVLRKYPDRHKHLWLNYVAVAACVVLAIFGGFKYLGNNVSTENNSSANNGGTSQMSGIADMVGDAENKNESADQSISDDNGNLRDEFAGSTDSLTDVSWHYRPVYMEITEISENSFRGRVIEQVKVSGETHFNKNQIITVIYRESQYAKYDTLFIKDLSVGEKVYVIYGEPNDTIYTPYIRYDNKF